MSALIRSFHKSDLPEIKAIFFESSTKKSFKDDAEKEQFYYKYLGFYLEHFPELVLVAFDKRVLGYVLGATNSNLEELYELQPHLKIFEEHFQKYPSHLHINCHFEARGKGIGKKLVRALEQKLRQLKIAGLHIMTAPDAANKSFYTSLGFYDEILQDFRGSSILLMGKAL